MEILSKIKNIMPVHSPLADHAAHKEPPEKVVIVPVSIWADIKTCLEKI